MALIQLITSFFGSLGFALVFNVNKKILFPCACGGVICCGIYLICYDCFCLHLFLANLAAGAVCQIYAECLARLLKSPATVFYITALIPMIPGGSLYRTMDAAVSRNFSLFYRHGAETLYTTLGLAIGISLVSGILHLLRRKKKKI
ncbi:MAG: threonine/serine exporter family protein [Clostridia bacterium]|nr:threonine/serine exporter family protein [Clostridia bacterium]